MLFEDNLAFFNYTMPEMGFKKIKDELVSVEKGFNSGNMFSDLYTPYKNYCYKKLTATDAKGELLLEIMALSFAINDLSLYLDLNPDDLEMFAKFHKLLEKSCEKEMEYVKKYGPLELVDEANSQVYDWSKNPWPWEKSGGIKYV